MIFEGIGKYVTLILLIFLIVLITVKICEYFIFKSAKIEGYKAFIPFYNRLLLIEKLDLKKDIFYKTLIPFANLYYYYIIIEKLLDAYNLDNKQAIYFILIPMYKFPELIFKKPQFMLHMYDNTEQFLNNEKSLYEKEVEEIQQTENNNENESVFLNNSLQPDERKETIIKAGEELKEEKTIIKDEFKPKVCPNCKTKLEPTAKICFFCGKEV